MLRSQPLRFPFLRCPMPSLPKKAPPRPWVPAAPPRAIYQQHAARSPEYGTARWQKVRLAQLAIEPCCRVCTKQGRTTAADTVDHITPVRLGGGMWDTSNYQSLCKSCHQRKSRQERDMKPATT